MRWRTDIETIAALVRRAANELLRVPGAAIPGVLAPTIFFLGLTSVFGHLTLLPGFDSSSYQSFLIPISLMQGAGFTGAATGVNLARDIEQGWFDRLLVSPAPRPVLLAGLVISASLRSLIPATVLLVVGFSLGVSWPVRGIDYSPRRRYRPGLIAAEGRKRDAGRRSPPCDRQVAVAEPACHGRSGAGTTPRLSLFDGPDRRADRPTARWGGDDLE